MLAERAKAWSWQGTLAGVLVAVVSASFYQRFTRLFVDRSCDVICPYGLAYVAICVLITGLAGRQLGVLTLKISAIGAAFLLPLYTTLAIGDPRGWVELLGLLVVGTAAALGTETADNIRRKTRTFDEFRQARKQDSHWRKALNKHLYRAWSWQDRRRRPPQVLILFSHMRSGSSLLTHLLSNHSSVCGYGETHLTYTSYTDLEALAGKVMMMRRRRPGTLRANYVLDKILHDLYLEPPALPLLMLPNVRVVFLVREPLTTMASLMDTFGFSEQEALDHYQTRLTAIARAANALASQPHLREEERPVAVTYEELLHQTALVFRLLERFLGLSEPLSENYRLLPTTGKTKIGDPSENIRAGSILRDRPKSLGLLSPEIQNRAERSFQSCCDILRQCCQSLPCDPV